MKVQNILIDKMIIFFNADIITLYIKELRLLGKIHAHARSFLIFLKKECVTYITIGSGTSPYTYRLHTRFTCSRRGAPQITQIGTEEHREEFFATF